MKIGVDVDGVLTNIEKYQLEKGSIFFDKYNKKIVDPKGYETTTIFDVSSELDDLFWNEYYRDYCTNSCCREYANDVINKLKNEGNEIIIITARSTWIPTDNSMSREEARNIIINWLKQNDICYDKIIISEEDKLDICLNNNIDIMIEDKVDNINKISTKIPVICFNAGYNEKCKGENIYRAYSWYDIYHILKNKIK